jgi:hypothetical protein
VYGGAIQVMGKVRKTRHQNPLFGHIGDEISKKQQKKKKKQYTGHHKFGGELSLPCLFFS